MNAIRMFWLYLVKQALAILIAAGILVFTVIGMVVAALLVMLFGLGAAMFWLIAPMMGIVMRDKIKGWSSVLDEFTAKMKEATNNK